MNALITPHDVVLRFAQVRRAIMTHRLLTAIVSGAVVLVAATLLLAIADFFFELPQAVRIAGFVLAIAAGLVTAMTMATQAVRQGTTRRAAAEMERRFRSIGQRLRTTIDLAGRDGIDKLPLSMALATETNQECDSVQLESIVPRRQTWWSVAALAGVLVVLMLPALLSNSWQTTLARTIGIDRPYTRLSVEPGSRTVDEGTPVEAKLTLTGRTERDVKLRVRAAEQDAEWSDVKLKRTRSEDGNEATLIASLGQVRKPLEYQFETSVGSTDLHRIDVRYPVRIEAIELTVRRPSYTGLEDRVFEKTDITALEGSEITCRVRSQRPLDHVDVAFSASDPDAAAEETNVPEVVAVSNDDGRQWEFSFVADDNVRWTMTGSSPAGTPMAPVDGQVRVKADRAPKIRWASPAESLFVHTLAEVPMNVRVEDDYGLSEAAIRFEISGNDGFTLADFQFDPDSPDATPTARQVLESILPLEHFPLSEKDYIAYYAYAVDNHPENPHQVESERRYIDIRQLKIDVLIRDNDGNNDDDNNNRDALATLDELIGRQRYLINRTRSLRVMDANELSDKLGLLDRHVERQSDLADVTRLVGERLQERGNDNIEAMFQAEASMIQAADSLTVADFEAALPQQEDAQRFLVEARTEIERVTGRGNRRSMSGSRNRNMLNMVRQRLRRRGRGDDQQNGQRDLVARVRAAASTQMSIARAMTQPGAGGGSPEDPASTENDGDIDPTATDVVMPQETPPADQDAAEEEPSPTGNAADDPEAEPPAGDEAEAEEPEPTISERQTALLEEVTEINDEIATRSWPSELIPDRIDSAVARMDQLTSDITGDSPSADEIREKSEAVASDLLELALNIELLDPPVPSGRLSGVRDLTASLAELESELASTPTEQSDAAVKELRWRAEAVERRAATLADVTKAAADAEDSESQSYADALARFLAEEPLLEKANMAGGQAEEISESEAPGVRAAETNDERQSRASELREMAQAIDEILRDIVDPELEQLRQLEATGSGLQQQLDQEGDLPEEEVLEFADDLQKGKLPEPSQRMKDSMAKTRGQDSPPQRPAGLRGALRHANEQIRERIRELILRELEADRDGPVPPEYRTAVDDYFRRVIESAP